MIPRTYLSSHRTSTVSTAIRVLLASGSVRSERPLSRYSHHHHRDLQQQQQHRTRTKPPIQNAACSLSRLSSLSSLPFLLPIVTWWIAEQRNEMSTLTTTTTTLSGARKPPPKFGRTVPRLSNRRRYGTRTPHDKTATTGETTVTTNVTTDLENVSNEKGNEDCPLCRKYSKGPCGLLFRTWLRCTDENGKGNEDCDALIPALDACLCEHSAYYESIDLYDDSHEIEGGDDGKKEEALLIPKDVDDGGESHVGKDEGVSLKRAWNEFVIHLEESQRKRSSHPKDSSTSVSPFAEFPPGARPHIQVRLESRLGVVEFPPRQSSSSSFNSFNSGKWGNFFGKDSSSSSSKRDKVLLAGYVKDQDGTLLCAGSAQDMYFPNGGGSDGSDDGGYVHMLRFNITRETKYVVACALYECVDDDRDDEKDGPILFQRVEYLPTSEVS